MQKQPETKEQLWQKTKQNKKTEGNRKKERGTSCPLLPFDINAYPVFFLFLFLNGIIAVRVLQSNTEHTVLSFFAGP